MAGQDFISAVVVRPIRAWWSFVALCLFNTGLGGFLCGLAMLDLGTFPLPIFILWSAGCAFLVWLAEPTRKRYLKWVRTSVDDPRG